MFDWLTGTRRPGSGIAPSSPDAVHHALMAVNRPTAPFAIRPCVAGDGEAADLVGEWRLTDPLWYAVFGPLELKQFRVFMRLYAATAEVRTIDRAIDVNWSIDGPTLSLSRSRGTFNETTFRLPPYVETTTEGARFTFRFSTSELKRPLQAAVVARGWTWRAGRWRL